MIIAIGSIAALSIASAYWNSEKKKKKSQPAKKK